METKIKAKELIDKFLNFVDWNDLINDTTNRKWAVRNAKECALISVNEILNESPSKRYWDTYDDETPSAITFWEEVKTEIINYEDES